MIPIQAAIGGKIITRETISFKRCINKNSWDNPSEKALEKQKG